jgi:signal transduction histidine kinase
MTAAAELSAAILSTPTHTALDLIVNRVREVSDGEQVSVLLPNPQDARFRVAAAAGMNEATLRGAIVEPSTVFAGTVLDDAEPHAQPSRQEGERDVLLLYREGVAGPVMAVPLRTRAQFWGVLCIARDPDGERFSAVELEGAADLASRASIALELARASEDAHRALLADDRRRIARDLHDHVIQQLFGAGLGLQAVAGRLGPGPDGDSLAETVDQLDDAIAQIRTVVFALSHRDDSSVRHRLLDVVGELSSGSRRPPAVRFTGAVDLVVRDDLATDLVAVGRELLSNAIRHADADHISLAVEVADGQVTVTVEDDGRGIDDNARRSGLDNLRERAERRHGSFTVESSASGTTGRWTAPTAASSDAEETRETA